MIKTANCSNNKSLSIFALVLMGVTVLGLQSCNSGGDDTPAVVPDVTLSSTSVSEGNSGTTNLDFTVTLSEATTASISVAYVTSDDSATAGQDYTATTGTLTVAANTTSAIISVPVTGDLEVESDEIFNLQISSASGATISNGSQIVTGTIITDDLAGYYTGNATVNELGSSLVIVDNDLQVIVADDRMVLINLTNNLIYIAPMTSLANNSFSTTARIYKDGDFTTTTDITASFIAGASITLTLTGTGEYTTGSMSLAYSAKNTVAPLVFAPLASWNDPLPLVAGIGFTADTNIIDIATTGNVPTTAIEDCDAMAVDLIDVVSEQTGRMRSFSALVNACAVSGVNGTTLNGYFTTFENTLPDDRILFVWFNDDGAHASSLID